ACQRAVCGFALRAGGQRIGAAHLNLRGLGNLLGPAVPRAGAVASRGSPRETRAAGHLWARTPLPYVGEILLRRRAPVLQAGEISRHRRAPAGLYLAALRGACPKVSSFPSLPGENPRRVQLLWGSSLQSLNAAASVCLRRPGA